MDLSRGARLVVAVIAVLAALFSAGLIAEAELLPAARHGQPRTSAVPGSDPEPITLDTAQPPTGNAAARAPGEAAGAATIPPPDVPAQGSGQFVTAGGQGQRAGTGRVLRYEVVVETSSPVSADEFARAVEAILADPRGWTAGHQWGFQRVPAGPSDFTIHLASPATTDDLCARSGVLGTAGEVSCRGGRNVVINMRRWQLAVPWYADAVDQYRQMVVNHEVGHFLGFGHAGCPGAGLPAPVMQQQSLDLQTCVRNPWPYPDGRTFVTGPPASP
jgi:hypothetical protein